MADGPCTLCGAPPHAHDDAACSLGWTPAAPALRPPVKLLVCGSRDWPERERATIRAWLARFPPGSIVIHGAARGADTIAGEEAVALGFTVRAYPTDWTMGKAAGILRNASMLAAEHVEGALVTRCLAFTPSLRRGSPARLTGTGDMVARCIEAGIVATVVPPGGMP